MSTSAPAPITPRDPDVELGLRELVHRGPHANVYRGTYEGTDVAIKVYPPDLVDTRRTDRERAAQMAVSHPTVARWLSSGALDSGGSYHISEWVEGVTLESHLAEGRIPFEELHPIVTAIASGLRAIHAEGIVHRDVKPSNIMLPRAGASAAVLLDFGHALMLDEIRLTESGLALGSANFMSPEQATGAAIDGRADLYALGVVMYASLTGHLPFEARSPAEALAMHRDDPVIPPRRRAPDAAIGEAPEHLVMWLLAKDPEERLPNTQVLLHALRAMRTDHT